MSGSGGQNGQDMLEGVQLYLDKVNAAGSGFRYKVKLKAFDDRNEPERARRIAQTITEDPGHFRSTGSLLQFHITGLG